jgi:hypothetical protein
MMREERMSSFDKCEICKTFHWSNEKCPDVYSIYHYEYNGNYPIEIRGNSFEDAAEKYATYYNSDDYPMNNDYDGIDIKIIDQAGEVKYFNVTAEPAIEYQVTEIETDTVETADGGNQ